MNGHPHPGPAPRAQSRTEEEVIDPAAEAALAEHIETQTYRWRLQVTLAESVMMMALVLIAGWALHLPARLIFRAAAMAGAASLAAGLFLLWMSTWLVRTARYLTAGYRR